jgi:peptidoglycan/LPS O-acetylase OafA/YrhL
MDAMAIGGWIALAMRDAAARPALARVAQALWPLAALGFAAITLWDRDATWRGAATQTVGYTLLGLMFGSLLITVLTLPPGHTLLRVLTTPALRFVGKVSYALYLTHLPVRGLVRDYVFHPSDVPTVLGSQLPGQFLFYVVAGAAALAVASASWHLWEKHFIALKDRFTFTPLHVETNRFTPGNVMQKA